MDASSEGTPAADAAATPGSVGWTCGACGYGNADTALCERCGVSRAWLEDRPLDVPPRPGWFERPATWMALLHLALAALGALLLARPELAPFLALRPPLQAAQTLLSLTAAWTSLNRAATERAFRAIELQVPQRVAVDEPIVATVRLVPYAPVGGVSVEFGLLSNTFERVRGGRRNQRRMRSRVVARHRLLGGGTLRGRREATFEARFVAPFPTPEHRSAMADVEASLLGALAWLVPGLGEAARNLREHGGIHVRLIVRAGPWRRVVEKRVFVYHLGAGGIDIA